MSRLFTSLIHCDYANFQSDFVIARLDLVIDDFQRHCKNYGAEWGVLYDYNGNLIATYRKDTGVVRTEKKLD